MTTQKEELLKTLDRFAGVKVAVVGDLLADLYVNARPAGLSREAPVMILKEEDRRVRPGGAANAVNNVLALSGRAFCVGLVGDDEAGRVLLEELEAGGADGGGVITVAGAKTYTKMRVFAGDLHTVKQQVLRLDCEGDNRMDAKTEALVVEAISLRACQADAILVSD